MTLIAELTAQGLPCRIRKVSLGFLCGYVAVPEGHPLHGLNYSSSVPTPEWLPGADLGKRGVVPLFIYVSSADRTNVSLDVLFDVHGGLTYAGTLGGDQWWFGFDCGHAGDAISPDADCLYRDEAYVRAECERLAAQIVAYPQKAEVA